MFSLPVLIKAFVARRSFQKTTVLFAMRIGAAFERNRAAFDTYSAAFSFPGFRFVPKIEEASPRRYVKI
jgi:hypothetical protein